MDKSKRPHHNPKEHTPEEIKLRCKVYPKEMFKPRIAKYGSKILSIYSNR